MFINSRRSASAFSAMAMNSLPRWLISITDMPLPCQSRSSSRARCNTSSGSTAGPALKLNSLAIYVVTFNKKSKIGFTQLCFVGFGNTLHTREMLLLAKINQMHALGVASDYRDFFYTRANECAAAGDEHRLVFRRNDIRPHHPAIARAHLNRDHALTTATVLRIFSEQRALAVAVARRRQYRGLGQLVGAGDNECDHRLFGLEREAAHAARGAPHGAHVALGETHHLAGVGEQQNIGFAACQSHPHQTIADLEVNGNDAAWPRPRELGQRGLFDCAVRGRHEHIAALGEVAYRQNGADLLALVERQQVYDRLCVH